MWIFRERQKSVVSKALDFRVQVMQTDPNQSIPCIPAESVNLHTLKRICDKKCEQMLKFTKQCDDEDDEDDDDDDDNIINSSTQQF